MQYQEYRPSEDLRHIIHHFFQIEIPYTVDKLQIEAAFSNISTGLNFNYLYEGIGTIGYTPKLLDMNLPMGYFIQPMDTYYQIKHEGRIACINTVFQPGAFYRLFGIPISEFVDQKPESLGITVGRELEEVHFRVIEARDTLTRIGIIENFFRKKLKQHAFSKDRFDYALSIIRKSQARINIHTLAKELRISSRHLQREFLKYAGLSPKVFLEVLRFNHAVYLFRQDRNLKQTDIAYRVGYYDQAHFIKSFAKMSGFTPLVFQQKHLEETAGKIAWKPEF